MDQGFGRLHPQSGGRWNSSGRLCRFASGVRNRGITKGRSMLDYLKLVILGVVVVCAAIAANYARDAAYLVHMLLFMAAGGGLFLFTLRRMGEPAAPVPTHEYMDGPVRAAASRRPSGASSVSWWDLHRLPAGLSGQLNFEWAQGYPELRAAASAAHLGGDLRLRRQRADLASFYVVQRTSAARFGAATSPGSCSGATSSSSCWRRPAICWARRRAKEYAEPEWYIDLWLTIVWVGYLLVFVGTLMKRKEPHIYVANWFFWRSSSPSRCCIWSTT
jgi:cytochrome c oxidase cbb3-type subunit 1